jgi:hypothetical protein
MCLFLSANTLHFLQPLHNALTSLVEKVPLKKDLPSLQLQMSFYQYTHTTEREAFTLWVEKRAFLNNEIFVFDPARILHLLALKCFDRAKKTQIQYISIMVKFINYLLWNEEKERAALTSKNLSFSQSTFFTVKTADA